MTMVSFKPPKAEPGKAGIDGTPPKAQDEGPAPPPVLHLSHEHLKKLNLHDLKAGQKLHIHAVAHVHHASSESHSDGPSGGKAKGGEGHTKHNATLHFHKMEVGRDKIGNKKEVDQAAESAKGAKAEMDKALNRAGGGSRSKASEGDEDGGGEPTPRGGGDNG